MNESILVLYVDDEPTFADLLKTYLEDVVDDEFSVVPTSNPSEGRAFLDDRPVDCVVCDYDMPEVDGLEFLSDVRESYPRLPFILLTGKGDERIASEAIGRGATDYLQKPAGSRQYRTLANRIHKTVLEYRRQRSARREAEHLRTVYGRLGDPIIAIDDDWRYDHVNERAERLLGRTEAELLGTSVWETLPGDESSRLETGLRRALAEQEPVEIEVSLDRPGGVLEARIFPDEEGVSIHFREIGDADSGSETLERTGNG